MAGKTKSQKKKRAKVRKRTAEDQSRLKNKAEKKVVPVESPGGIPYSDRNNAEEPPPKVNEDAGKDAEMEKVESEHETNQEILEHLEEGEFKHEPVFDPKSVVANILKKKNESK